MVDKLPDTSTNNPMQNQVCPTCGHCPTCGEVKEQFDVERVKALKQDDQQDKRSYRELQELIEKLKYSGAMNLGYGDARGVLAQDPQI